MPLELVEAPAVRPVPATAYPVVPDPAARRAAPDPVTPWVSVDPPVRPMVPDPPARPRARHRRPRDLPALADRWWSRLLTGAVVLFAACGPAHALGHTDVVYHAVLVGLTLGALAVPLGLLALRRTPPPEPPDREDPPAPSNPPAAPRS